MIRARCRTRIKHDGRRGAGRKAGRQFQGIGAHDGTFDDHGGQLTANRAAVCLYADGGDGLLIAAFVRGKSGRRLASSVWHEQGNYQNNSDSRAMKDAVHHVFRVAPV